MDYQILFVIDTTGSMGHYISSLKPSILQLTQMINLLGTDIKLGILEYKDFSDKYPINWIDFCDLKNDLLKITTFVDKIEASGGDDYCEASKTAINKSLDLIKGLEKQTLVIHFTDALPHCPNEFLSKEYNSSKNNDLEKSSLTTINKPFDWIKICDNVHSLNVQIITLYSNSSGSVNSSSILPYYSLLGQVIEIESVTVKNITSTTIDVILSHFKDSAFKNYTSYEIPKTYIKLNDEIEFGKKKNLPTVIPVEYLPIDKIFKTFPSINNLVKNFKENNQITGKRTVSQPYRDLVYKILDEIMDTKEGVLSMSYNPIFGTLWRLVSTFNKIDERSVKLNNKMAKEMSKLNEQDMAEMRVWLEESYNKEEEIKETIKSIELKDDSKVFIIDMKEPVTRRQLMDVMRGTSDSNSTGKIIRFLSTVQTVNYKDIPNYKKDNYSFIPADLPSNRVMALISHLIAPGIIMSPRPAAIISILTCLALEPSAFLYNYASDYLKEECGKWIDIHKDELADNYCMQFIHIINQLHSKPVSPEFLTIDEIRFYANLESITNIMKNLNKYMTVEKPYSAKSKSRTQFDHTLKCNECQNNRSFTLMHSENQCGPCYLTEKNSENIVTKILNYQSDLSKTVEQLKKLPSQLSDKTNLFNCSSCSSYYSVISINDLNVKPKCHFCRIKQTNIISSCKVCTNIFIDEAKLLDSKFGGICGQCTNTNESFEELKICIKDMLTKSPGLLEIFGIHRNSINFLSSNKSIYKGCTSSPKEIEFIEAVEKPKDDYFWKNSYHNQNLIIQNLKEEINHGKTEAECTLCYSLFPFNKLKPACGNCTQQLCIDCAKGWYSQNSPGNVVLETYSKCPFCKQSPKFEVIKNYNRILCQFNNRKHKYKSSVYEAWCFRCGVIDEFAPKECSNDIPNLNGEYICAICKNKEEKLNDEEKLINSNYNKTCPGCDVMTYKIGGCNHITCTVEGCETHWCWVCRWKHTPDSIGIYEHLNKEHGGIFDFERNNEYEEDEEEDEEEEYN